MKAQTTISLEFDRNEAECLALAMRRLIKDNEDAGVTIYKAFNWKILHKLREALEDVE